MSSANFSPPSPKLDPPKPFVRRLRPMAVGVVVTLLALLVAATLISGLIKSSTWRRAQAEALAAPSHGRAGTVDGGPLAGLPSDYTFARPPAPPPKPAEPTAHVPPDPDEHKLLAALRRELQEAIDSPLVFQGARGGLRHSSAPQSGGAASEAYAALVQRDAPEEHYVRTKLQSPRSAYELKAGAVIPGALVTAINSDLPGLIIGQVTENVFDSVSGAHLLIPQGTRLIGGYDREIRNGQNRLLIVWRRLILPNGDSISLEEMPGTDPTGAAGLRDEVDYHALRLTGAVLLSTVIAYGDNLGAGDRQTRDETTVAADTVASESGRVGQRVIDRELDLAPTVMIRAGWPFRVLVGNDLTLRPYLERR